MAVMESAKGAGVKSLGVITPLCGRTEQISEYRSEESD
jgi:hypothetical protein